VSHESFVGRSEDQKAETVLKECARNSLPTASAGWGAFNRRTKASCVPGAIPELAMALLADWTRLTHDGWRFADRCVRCGETITGEEHAELEAIRDVYRRSDHD